MKKIYKNFLKLTIILIIVIYTYKNNNLYAAVNNNYGEGSTSIGIDADSVISSSTIMDMLGQFVFAIGNIIENATSGIVNILTGENTFPWADRVIFNTMPLLDINFIHPDERSIFSQNYGVGDVVRNVYFTGLSIALGFLGVIIAIMAIRLAISTIASEKAKYKEAITKWLTAIILLFSMHFVLSFIFYLNEELVKVASSILNDTITQASEEIQLAIQDKLNINRDQQVENFVASAKATNAVKQAQTWNPIGIFFKVVEGIGNLITGNSEDRPDANAMLDELATDECKDITYAFITNTIYRENCLNSIYDKTDSWGSKIWQDFWTSLGGVVNENIAYEQIYMLYEYVTAIRDCSDPNSQYHWLYNTVKDKETYESNVQAAQVALNKTDDSQEQVSRQLNILLYTYAYEYNITHTLSESSITQNLIGGLGNFFKETAWYSDVASGGWSPNEVSVVSALLYSIFVIQSVMFFVAYFKRLFYVVILAVIAPFVVIYDFFTKSMSL